MSSVDLDPHLFPKHNKNLSALQVSFLSSLPLLTLHPFQYAYIEISWNLILDCCEHSCFAAYSFRLDNMFYKCLCSSKLLVTLVFVFLSQKYTVVYFFQRESVDGTFLESLYVQKCLYSSSNFSDTVASYRIPGLKIFLQKFEVIEYLAPQW